MTTHHVQKPVERDKVNKSVCFHPTPSRHALFTKYDGVHVILGHDEYGNLWAYSRTKDLLRGVTEQLRLGNLPQPPEGTIWFAELWSVFLTFPEISGLARRHKLDTGEAQRLTIRVFDALKADEYRRGYSPRPWAQRVQDVPEHLKPTALGFKGEWTDEHLGNLSKLVHIPSTQPGPVDGLIVRDMNAHWEPGPATNGAVVKFKPRPTYDLRVVGVEEGKGRLAGKLGAVIVETRPGVTCKVGTGFDDATRSLSMQSWVGKIIEVSTLGVTKDGKLREPAFICVRNDKEDADTV